MSVDHSLSDKRAAHEAARKSGSGNGGRMPPGPPDDLNRRLDEHQTHLVALYERAGTSESKLSLIDRKIDGLATREQMALLPTKDTVRNWGIGLIVAVVASVMTMTGLFFASAANQLSAFSAGLAAVQTVVSVKPTP